MQSQTRVDEKRPAVDFADINLSRMPFDNIKRRLFRIERDTEIFCKIVERAERQNAECFIRADKFRRDRRQRSVAAARDNRLKSAASRSFCRFDEFRAGSRQRNASFDVFRIKTRLNVAGLRLCHPRPKRC